MTKDEVLDLALEALEGLKSIPGGRHELHELNAIHRKHDRAIAAIKQARSAPVQEPVAWISPNGNIHFDHWLDSAPLYTTPPAQPAPVPLTEQEFEALHWKAKGYVATGLMYVVRIVEAHHGITKGQP
jgi:hypothetical protein